MLKKTVQVHQADFWFLPTFGESFPLLPLMQRILSLEQRVLGDGPRPGAIEHRIAAVEAMLGIAAVRVAAAPSPIPLTGSPTVTAVSPPWRRQVGRLACPAESTPPAADDG